MQPIQSASIHYNEQGTPVSDLFDDVYFSNESGLEETQYVFLQQNGLPQRFFNHQRRYFHIIETGFGTGLNFLLAWQNFRVAQKEAPSVCCERLYFSTFEKYPLKKQDLAKALESWPLLAELAALLLSQYPEPVAGCHRLQFDEGRVTLDLWLGDVHDSMPQLSAQNSADAWFLDGFAPSKNPQMWQPELFSQMARLSQTGTTVATFTSAGLVRRGLADVGFAVKKVKGYGRKREMCIGIFQPDIPSPPQLPEQPEQAAESSASTQTAAQPDLITIVGGGLAAISLALTLQQHGRQVRLLCMDDAVAQQASHNRQGALYPQLQASWSPVSMLHALAFGFAARFYQNLKQQFDFPADFCGVLTLACNQTLAVRQQKMAAEPAYQGCLFQQFDADQASAVAGLSLPFAGLYYPAGGWIAPQAFCQAALKYLQQQSGFEVIFGCKVNRLEWQANSATWQLDAEDVHHHQPQLLYTKNLVLACGSQIHSFAQTQFLPLNLVRGQVSHVRSQAMAPLKTVICHQGYLTPALDGLHCVGATFDRSRQQALLLESDNQANLALVQQVLQQPAWFNDAKVESAKAGLRTTVPDHLPVAGFIAPGLHLFGGLGARGLLFAPLLAQQLAAQLCNEPLPLSEKLSVLIHPARFLTKQKASL